MKSFQQYIIEAPKIVKQSKSLPKVLMVSLPNIWNINEDDLRPLKKICDFDWIQAKNITQEKLAKSCIGFDHLMLNVDCIKSNPNKMERLDERFYNHSGIKSLKSLNQDMTDMDYFSPFLGLEKKLIMQQCPNTTTDSVAESTITEILLHTRGRHLAYGDGDKMKCRTGINLKGKIAGIVGCGNIGGRVANILESMGMDILVYDVNPNIGRKITSLNHIFKEANVITVHIPTLQRSGKSNINFIDEKLLNLCNDAILVNLATDVVVNADAAAKALRSGKLRGYSTQHNYSEEYGNTYMSKLKNIPEFHESPCSFDSPESQKNIKRVWIQNTISTINGNPQNIWN